MVTILLTLASCQQEPTAVSNGRSPAGASPTSTATTTATGTDTGSGGQGATQAQRSCQGAGLQDDPGAACIVGTIRIDVDGDGPEGEVPVEGAAVALEGHPEAAAQSGPQGAFVLAIGSQAAGLRLTESGAGGLAAELGSRPFNLMATYEQDGVKFAKRVENLVFAGGRVLDVGALTLSETGAIKGRVLLGDGVTPLGTDVYIPGMSFIAKAAEDGSFLILYVPEGEYTLMFEKSGYFYESLAGVVVVSKQIAQIRPVTLLAQDEAAPETAVASGPPALTSSRIASFTFTSTESGGAYRCRLDNGAPADCRTPHTVVDVGEGSHVLRVAAVDGSGNVDQSEASHAWVVDLTPPLLAIDTKPQAVTAQTSASFVFGSSESVTYTCRLDDLPVACTATTALTGLSPGNHTFQVYATDAAGNISATRIAAWQIDTTTLDVVATQVPPAMTNATSATIAFVANKSATFACVIDGGAGAPCTSPVSLTGLSGGAHSLTVTGTDAGGGVDPVPLTVNWTVDNTPPAVPTLTPVAGGLTNDSTPTLAWSAGPADTHHYELEVDASSSFNSSLYRSFNPVLTNTTTVLPALTDGTWYFRVKTVDGAGNASAFSLATSFTVDTTAPGTPAGDYLPDPINDPRPTFSWSAAGDATSYRIVVASDAAFATVRVDVAGITGTSYQPASSLPEGGIFWKVAAADAAGNQGAYSLVRTFVIDSTVPGTPVAGTVATPSADTTPTMTWSTVAGAAVYHVQVATDVGFTSLAANDASVATTSYTTAALTDNIYYWRVFAVDGAGNRSGASAPQTFVIDTTAPNAPSLVAYTPNPTNDLTPTLTWQHPGGGATSFDVEIHEGAVLRDAASGIAVTAYTPSTPLPVATLSWKVRARDTAGNVGAWSAPGSLTTTSAAASKYKFARQRTSQPLPAQKLRNAAATGPIVYYYNGGTGRWQSSVFKQNAWTAATDVCAADTADMAAVNESVSGVPVAACRYYQNPSERIGIYEYDSGAGAWNQLSSFVTASTAYPWAVIADAAAVHVLYYGIATGVTYRRYDRGTGWDAEEVVESNAFGSYGLGGVTTGATDWLPMMAFNGAEVGVFYYASIVPTWRWKERDGGAWTTRGSTTYCHFGGVCSTKMQDSQGFRYEGGFATVKHAFYMDFNGFGQLEVMYKDVKWDGASFAEITNTSAFFDVGMTGNPGDWDMALYVKSGATGGTAYPIEDDDGAVLTQSHIPNGPAGSQPRPLVVANPYGNPLAVIKNLGTGLTELATSFTLTTLDVGAGIGKHTALGIASTGDGRIAYYDSVSRKLKLAEKITGSWTVSTIDNGTDVGAYAALALKANDKGVIAYYDGNTGDLKVATEGATWTNQTVDAGGDVGQYAGVAVNSLGRPVVSYYDVTNGDLKVATFDGTNWTAATVDATDDSGKWTGIAVDGADRLHVSYYDATSGDLMYARYDGSWTTSAVDSTGDVGRHTAIAVTSGNNPVISYQDATNADLKVARYDGAAWTTETVLSAGAVGEDTSVAVDAAGRIHVTAYATDTGNLVYCLRDSIWSCKTVDGDENAGQNKGRYTSVRLNPVNGAPSASYYDVGEGGVSFLEGLALY